MKKPSLEYSKKTHPIVWLIRVIPVAVLAFAMFRFVQPEAPSAPLAAPGPVATSTSEVSTTTIALVNENAVTVVDLNGQAKRMTAAEFTMAYPSSTWPKESVQVSNGQWTVSHLPTGSASGTATYALSTNGTWTAGQVSTKADGASVIRVTSQQKKKDLVLRASTGAPIADASIVGWFDDERMMIIGHTTSTKWLYAFSVQGTLQPIIALPDTLVFSQAKKGEFWYVTAVPGEGIESNPKGPSDVHRVVISPTIQDTVEYHDDQHVVISFSGTRPLAYTLDTGESFAQTVSLGARRPLLLLPDGRWLLRDGFGMLVFDSKTGATRKLGTAPEGTVSVFVLE